MADRYTPIIDVSDMLNLTVTSPITLTGDDIGLDQSAIDHSNLAGLTSGDDHTQYILKSLFNADTFLYAASDNTPVATSPADVLAALSGHAGASFAWNSQSLTDIASVTASGTAGNIISGTATTGNGLYGVATGSGNGVYGSSQLGRGVHGFSASDYAGFFESDTGGTQLLLKNSSPPATGFAAFVVDTTGNLTITDNGGNISFDNENLSTTGTLEAGAITGTSLITGGDIGIAGDTDLLQLAANALTVNGTIGSGAITSTGAVEGTSITDGVATLASGDLTGLTSLVVDNITINGNGIENTTATLDILYEGQQDLHIGRGSGAGDNPRFYITGAAAGGTTKTGYFGVNSSLWFVWDCIGATMALGPNASRTYLMGNAGGNVEIFSGSSNGETREVRIHGDPTGLAQKYGYFWVTNVGGTSTFQISTEDAATPISLNRATYIGDGGTTNYTAISATGNILLPAGAADVGRYPIKFQAGTALDTPEAGVINYIDDSSGNNTGRFCITNIATCRAVDRTSDVAVATVTCDGAAKPGGDSTDEITLWTGAMPANSLVAGNMFKFHADGIVNSASNGDLVTIRIKVDGETKATLQQDTKKMVDAHWHVDANATQREIGASAKRAIHVHLEIDELESHVLGIVDIDTTASMDVTITAQWNNEDAGNVISLYQAFMEYKN